MSVAYTVTARQDRTFFTTISVIAATAVFVGFADTYYLKGLYGTPALPPLLHIHGVVFSAWMLLFVVQSALIKSGHTWLHRRLGLFGAFLALSMIVLGFITGVERARDAAVPERLLVFALGDIIVFAPLVTAAVYFRSRRQIHKRLMLLATISIIDAGTARWPVWAYVSSDVIVQVSLAYAVRDLFVVAAMIHDWRVHGRVHPAYWSAGLAVIAADPLRLALYTTGPWRAFTEFLLR